MNTARIATALSAISARLPRRGLLVSSTISEKSTATGREVLPCDDASGGGGGSDADAGLGSEAWLGGGGSGAAAAGGRPEEGAGDKFSAATGGGGRGATLGNV